MSINNVLVLDNCKKNRLLNYVKMMIISLKETLQYVYYVNNKYDSWQFQYMYTYEFCMYYIENRSIQNKIYPKTKLHFAKEKIVIKWTDNCFEP